ncbi:hypothetical protein OXX69_010910, partial [Metschnikowia pulcherrima]
GQSIGHSPGVPEFKREHIDFSKQPKDFKVDLIRAITGGDVDNKVKLETWESKQIDIEPEEVDLLAQQEEEEFMGSMNLEDSDLDE